jgi:hypothetical protein
MFRDQDELPFDEQLTQHYMEGITSLLTTLLNVSLECFRTQATFAISKQATR